MSGENTELERVRGILREAYGEFIAGEYRPGACDCDPSVGITGCLICAIREAIGDFEGDESETGALDDEGSLDYLNRFVAGDR